MQSFDFQLPEPRCVYVSAGEKLWPGRTLFHALGNNPYVQFDLKHSYALEDLGHYKAVVLSNPERHSLEDMATLKTYLEQGGGVLAFTSMKASALPNWFNVQLGDVTEERMLKLQRTATEHIVTENVPQQFQWWGYFRSLQSGNEGTVLVETQANDVQMLATTIGLSLIHI